MTEHEIREIVETQRKFFYTGAVLDVDYRMQALKKLQSCILKYENEINDAIKKDLGKSALKATCAKQGLF